MDTPTNPNQLVGSDTGSLTGTSSPGQIPPPAPSPTAAPVAPVVPVISPFQQVASVPPIAPQPVAVQPIVPPIVAPQPLPPVPAAAPMPVAPVVPIAPPVTPVSQPVLPIQPLPPQPDYLTQNQPPIQPITPPATQFSASSQPSPISNQSTTSVSFLLNDRKKLMIGGGILLLVLVGFVLASIFGVFGKKISLTGKSASTSLLAAVSGGSDLAKYGIDTDTDGYPDFVETAVSLDPTVSELDRCKKNNCSTSADQQTTSTPHNVVVILDASGSMGQSSGGIIRMDMAKQGIKGYLEKTAVTNAKVGLLIYGNKGSNNTADKPVSCASADMIAPIGSFSSTSADTFLSQVKPTGWTPIGLAINTAASLFNGKEGQDNEIVVVSDGLETCDTNPVGAATAAKSSASKIKVSILALGVTAAEQVQLQSIATAGGGSFATVNSVSDFDRQFEDLAKNGQVAVADSKCMLNAADTARSCYNAAHNIAYDYLSKLSLSYSSNKISKAEYELIGDLKTKLSQQQIDVTTKMTNDAVQYSKDRWNQSQNQN